MGRLSSLSARGPVLPRVCVRPRVQARPRARVVRHMPGLPWFSLFFLGWL
nr:MAG TPA: hypothetical protein [Caudoviricetes sp.]DAW44450.1 MAG TPA: hypothetical protein [Caudoviricetes sp.]